MEDKQLRLYEGNLSICCGPNEEFDEIEMGGKFKMQRQKKRK